MKKVPLFSEVFCGIKPIIGMIHLLPLPGSPRYSGDMSEIIDRACEDAEVLQRGGVDAVMIENYGDLPFYASKVPSETVAAMSVIAAVIQRLVKIPIGVNVLRNDGVSALSIATAIDADFIRVNVLTGAAVTDQGLILGEAARVARHRANLGSRAMILADVDVKHSYRLVDIPIVEAARDARERGLADGVIVTGTRTGLISDLKVVDKIKSEISKLPVLVGSGVDAANIAKTMMVADGVIVGTSLKVNSYTPNSVDIESVRKIVNVAKA